MINSINRLGGYILNPPCPTCYRNPDGTFIDKFINFGHLCPSDVTVEPSFSDHAAILIKIPVVKTFTYNTFKRFDYDNTNYDEFKAFIDRGVKRIVVPIRKNISTVQIDEIISEFDMIISQALRRFTPYAKSDLKNRVILSEATKKLQSSCKRLQRLLFRNRHAPLYDRLITVNKIKHLKIMIRNACNSDTGRYFTNIFNQIESNIDAFKVIKNLTGHKKRMVNENKDVTITGTENIASALGQQFVESNNLGSNMGSSMEGTVADDIGLLGGLNVDIGFNHEVTPLIENDADLGLINRTLPFHSMNLLTSAEEVTNIIASRSNKKSSGYDGLPFSIIKNFSPITILFLTVLFNHCLATFYYPNKWKRAIVSGISKPGKDNSIIKNWRPISQLSCISKIFEKIIANRMGVIMHGLGVFNNQYGFLKNHSTTHALARLQNEINFGLNNKKITSIML